MVQAVSTIFAGAALLRMFGQRYEGIPQVRGNIDFVRGAARDSEPVSARKRVIVPAARRARSVIPESVRSSG